MAALYMGYDTAYGNYGRILCGVRGLRAGNIYTCVCLCYGGRAGDLVSGVQFGWYISVISFDRLLVKYAPIVCAGPKSRLRWSGLWVTFCLCSRSC